VHLHRVKLVNFRQHAETEIILGSGITAIVGPNGSGKTTLFEAIAWAFYGNAAARGNRDSLRRYDAPPRAPMRVEVEFSLGAHEYRVARSLYGAELYQDGGSQPIANSQHEVTAKAARILGMDRLEFFNTYFTGQRQLAVMATMGAAERAKFLSRLLGYEKLRLAQDRLRARRSSLRGEISGLEQGLGDAKALERERSDAQTRVKDVERQLQGVLAERKAAEQALAEVGPAWKAMMELRESVVSLHTERRLAEQHVEEARREFQRLDRELANALLAKDELTRLEPELQRMATLREELERLERESRATGEHRAVTGQVSELHVQGQRLSERLQEMQELDVIQLNAQKALDEARSAVDELKKQEESLQTAWVRDQQDAETKRLALRDQYRDLQGQRKRIVEAGADGKCPTCARPLAEEYESVLKSLGRQLEEIEVDGRYYKQRVEQLATEPKELSEIRRSREASVKRIEEAVQMVANAEARVHERAAGEQELAQLRERTVDLERLLESLPDSYDSERHDVVQAEVRRLEPSVQTAARLRVNAERAEGLVSDAEKAERDLSSRESRVEQLGEAISALGYSEEAYVAADERYQAAESSVRGLEIRHAALQGDLKAAETSLDSVQSRIAERAKRLEDVERLRADLALHEELDTAFQDLRTELNAKLRPDLSELASRFLTDLTEGRYHELDLDKEYRINVREDEVPKPVLSGGEEDVSNLSLRLAISQMVAERAGQPLSLLVLDEIFGGLDEVRRQSVIELLRRLADRFPQVILITHIETVKEGADRVLRVSVDAQVGVAKVAEDEAPTTREGVAA
jgi:exonuclease SbcC